MKCKHCKATIKECRCGLGHGYIHTAAPVEEQLHRCWPNASRPNRRRGGGEGWGQGKTDLRAACVTGAIRTGRRND